MLGLRVMLCTMWLSLELELAWPSLTASCRGYKPSWWKNSQFFYTDPWFWSFGLLHDRLIVRLLVWGQSASPCRRPCPRFLSLKLDHFNWNSKSVSVPDRDNLIGAYRARQLSNWSECWGWRTSMEVMPVCWKWAAVLGGSSSI